jgi:small-conductance mechanosensitive channel
VDRLFGWFDQHNINLTALLATAVIVIAAFALSRVIRRILPNSLRGVAARLDFPYEIALTAARVLTGVMWVIVAMLLLEMWGISVGGLWTLLVSATTVIGVGFLATWTMVSNITASFFIAIWRPFRLGDTIEVLPENLKGRVIDSNLMFVVVRESGGSVIQIPNNLFFQRMFKVTGERNRYLFESSQVHRRPISPKRPPVPRIRPEASTEVKLLKANRSPVGPPFCAVSAVYREIELRLEVE